MNSKTINFISKASNIHGYFYDYSLVNYINSKIKIEIICKKHGIFFQTPNHHLCRIGCPKCGREKANSKITSNTYDFINKVKKIHGDRYDYSLTVYKKEIKKVKIVCSKHGVFLQTPRVHIQGSGCPFCAKCQKPHNLINTKEFIKRAISVHGNKYDYSLVKYKDSTIKVEIICSKHGIFKQTPNSHISGSGCIYCSIEYKALKLCLSKKEFIKRATKVHGDRYDYSKVIYLRSNVKVEITCPNHGSFKQTPGAHLFSAGCPFCRESSGERYISIFLDKNNIEYKREKKFKECFSIRPLLFDFYVPLIKTCIEYDGKQHYFPVAYFGGSKNFNLAKKRDQIKDTFCSKQGINLIRVPYYYKIEKIKEILKKEVIKKYYSFTV